MNDHGGRWLGLASAEAAKRLVRDGADALAVAHGLAWRRIARFFGGPIAWMIEAAAILSLVPGNHADFAIVTLMLLANASVGYWQEARAGSAIDALKAQLPPMARVCRGAWRDLPARDRRPA